MTQPKPSFIVRLLAGLTEAVFNHRRWFFYPQALLFLLCILYTVWGLNFITDRNALVGGEKEYHKVYLEFIKEFPSQGDLVVVAESESPERNRQFVERLGARIESQTNLFANLYYKFDFNNMGPKALLFLPEEDLVKLRDTLAEYRPILEEFAQATNFVSLINFINRQFRTAKREANAENDALVQALPALRQIIDQAAEAIRRRGTPPSPGLEALFESNPDEARQMYLHYDEGRVFLLTVQAKNERLNERAVEALRQLIAETLVEVPGLNVGLTGEPVLEVDEMAQSQKDTTVASIVAFSLVALIFVYGYHETGRPLKASACLLVGIAYTMGYTTLVIGHLNILTITFVPILVGLAIDFGVHLVTRYEEELWHGRAERESLKRAMVFTGTGIFTGALTTAAAFFAMAGTDFDGIQEMGMICGGGLLVSMVPMMTLLPVLLLRGKQNVLDHQLAPVLDERAKVESNQRARIENYWLKRPIVVVALVLGISLVCIYPARQLKFDYNLLHMQSEGLPAVIYQNKLIQSSDRSVLFGVVVASDLDQAMVLYSQLTNLPSVSAVEAMAPFLVEDQTAKLALLTQVKSNLSVLRFPSLDSLNVDLTALSRALLALDGYTTLGAQEAAKESPKLGSQLEQLNASVRLLERMILMEDHSVVAPKLAAFQRALLMDLHQTFSAFLNQDTSGPMRIEDLPGPMRQRFVGNNHKHLLQVFPKKDVWDREAQEEFVRELRTVDPLATGTPVQLLEYTTLLKTSFEEAAMYSLLAIAIMVFVHFKRILCVVLALLPVCIGMLWMMGIMKAVGISFNPANIMTLPLVIGVGVTNGIHILNRFAEEQNASILARSTGKAVLVSGLTTIAGFGSLTLADHQGIESLGYIMAVGTATCMVIALTFLPALLTLLSRAGWTIKKPSATCTIDTGSGGTEVTTSSMDKI